MGNSYLGLCCVLMEGDVLRRKRRRRWAAGLAVLGCLLLSACMGMEAWALGNKLYRERQSMVVIAHRAGASAAPENTVSALERAIADGAVVAEIDIRQMQDGTLVAVHDDNFIRTTGVDMPVSAASRQELSGLDAGSCFAGREEPEPVPTLEEMLDCARGRICLMIEVKVSGGEENLERQLAEVIRSRGMDRQCIIGSMNREVLERVKEYNPELATVYIAHNLCEEDYAQNYIDSYSIEAVNMTETMVERIHAQDKPIYGWTANSYDAMKLIADCGGDGIVTDNVKLAYSFLNRKVMFSVLTRGVF